MINIVLFVLSIISNQNLSGENNQNNEIIVCGWDEVFIVDLNPFKDKEGLPPKTWSWSAKDRKDLPNDFRGLFNSTDDCKPFDDGNKILITSSGGGVALVDRQKDEVLFYAKVANAHSADLLPNDRVAVAASHSADGKGDRLIIFDLNESDQEITSTELPWGHGVVWDNQRQLLWTLADEDILVFKLNNWDSANPELIKIATVSLPERGGHELYPLGDGIRLFVSTAAHCWYFNRESLKFNPHPTLANEKSVKSISQHPETLQEVYVQAEGDHWWAERIHFLDPERVLYEPGEHFYKVRWNVQVY